MNPKYECFIWNGNTDAGSFTCSCLELAADRSEDGMRVDVYLFDTVDGTFPICSFVDGFQISLNP